MTAPIILSVGSGQQYATINEAILAADTAGGNAEIQIQAGTYNNDGGYIWDGINNVTVEGVGGIVRIVDPAYNAGGKAAIVTGGQNILLKNLDISGVSVPDANGAGVRYDKGTLILDHVSLHDNQDGILGAPDPNGSITIQNSQIYNNGTDAGNTHNIYIGDIASFTLANTYLHDARVGHEVKSRAENNIITNNVIADNAGTSSYSIDLPNGGNATITGNLIEQGPNGQNNTIIAYGEEGGLHAGSAVMFSNNTVLNDLISGAGPLWRNNGATITGGGNQVWNVTDLGAGISPASVSTLGAEPNLKMAEAAIQATVDPASAIVVANLLQHMAYRFFSATDGSEFLVTNPDEVAAVLHTRPDLMFEGPAFGSISDAADPSAASIYRFFDTNSGTHFFTSSAAEAQTIQSTRPDLTFEAGSTFFEHATPQAGDSAVYRFFETSNGTHFFTQSASERAAILANRPDMVNEGIAFYAPPS